MVLIVVLFLSNGAVLSIVEQPTFLEYVRAKFEICFLLAVDFTASNGQKEFPTSLHHLDQTGEANSNNVPK